MAMKNTSVYIPEEDLEAFKKLAKKHNRNVSNMIVVLVREAIEKDPQDPKYIVTVWKEGYKFVTAGDN